MPDQTAEFPHPYWLQKPWVWALQWVYSLIAPLPVEKGYLLELILRQIHRLSIQYGLI